MNVILIPVLLLLIGLAVYKKVIEPRRAAGAAGGGNREARQPKADKKAAKARAVSSGSGRMGSVL